MDAQAELKGLSSPKIIGEITHEAAGMFVEDFGRVEGAVVDALAGGMEGGVEGGMEAVRGVWPRTVDEVRVLLM